MASKKQGTIRQLAESAGSPIDFCLGSRENSPDATRFNKGAIFFSHRLLNAMMK
jgi:hypothetical protein